MPLEVREVKSVLVFPELIQVHAAAFQDPPSSATALFARPGVSEQDAFTENLARYWWVHSINPVSRWVYVVDTDQNDKIIAGAQWYINTKPTGHAYQIFPYWQPEGEGREFCTEVFEQWAEIRDGRPASLQLAILFTHPDFRRRGAGGMAIQWGTEIADKMGLDCYVEASKMGVPAYESQGFYVMEERLIQPK